MQPEHSPFTVYPGGASARSDGAHPAREYQELWFSLARLHWASLVLVPAENGGSAAEVATSLAWVGSRLRDTAVTAIVATGIDYASARALAELQPRLLDRSTSPAAIEVEATPLAPDGGSSTPERGAGSRAILMPPFGRAIIAIQPVVDEPLGVAVAQAADAVVLCVEIGRARMPAARRTVELIGPERVIGAVLVR